MECRWTPGAHSRRLAPTSHSTLFIMTTDLRLPPGRAPRAASDFVQSILDALPAHIAVIDASGKIVAVNAAWRRFADTNGLGRPDGGVGDDYLAVAETATGPDAASGRAMAVGI